MRNREAVRTTYEHGEMGWVKEGQGLESTVSDPRHFNSITCPTRRTATFRHLDGDGVLNASPQPCTHPTPSAQLGVLLVASASLCFSSIPQKWMPGRQRNLSTGLSTPPSPNSPPLISPSLALPNHALRRLACSISTLNSSHTDSYTRRDCHWMDWRREMRTGWSSVFWECSANES